MVEASWLNGKGVWPPITGECMTERSGWYSWVNYWRWYECIGVNSGLRLDVPPA